MKTIKEIYDYREMIFNLVRKDLRGRYKGSVLGFLWTFANPLLQLIVYNIVFSTILKNGIDKYYLFLFVALIPWIFFSASLTGGASSVMNYKGMVTKIYFPREVLPIAHVTTCFVNMLYCFIIIFAVVLISGTPLNLVAICYLPLIMIVEYILALGIAMLASSVTVYFRDFEHILGILTMAWMFLTPIMYSIEIIPEEYLPIFAFNPMTSIITAYRDVLYYSQVPSINTLGQAIGLGLGILLIGSLVFNRLKRHFAEEF